MGILKSDINLWKVCEPIVILKDLLRILREEEDYENNTH